jgi:DNA helicase-2/ATP-dependent DNA helicase PcrA
MPTNAGDSPLDRSQQAFCSDTSDALRLLAPAGSGKTHSLLWRCLSIKNRANDRDGGRFLVLTFTRAARDELKDRLKRVPAFEAIRPVVEISTLNSWGFRWLRQRLTQPRIMANTQDRNFTMMNVLRPIWEGHRRVAEILGDARRSTRAARQLMDLMDQVKGLGFRHDKHDRIDGFSTHLRWLGQHGMRAQLVAFLRQLRDLELTRTDVADGVVWEAFEHYFGFWRESTEHMYRSGLLTLEDQKYWALIELERSIASQGVAGVGITKYRHIVVDEFQDINTLDLNLLKALSRVGRCVLTIVGDDDQAIYEWRGATPQFILHPDTHIAEGYRTHILEVNYRSPRNIVDLSQRLIVHNTRRVPKRVWPHAQVDAQVRVLLMNRLEDSVSYVHHEVKRLRSDVCCLARSFLTGSSR